MIEKIAALVFWHGAREGSPPRVSSRDGLIFLSIDRNFAAQFIDPLEKMKNRAEARAFKVTVKNPKVFHSFLDADWNAFMERGINGPDLLKAGFDSAVLVARDPKENPVIDIALTSLEQMQEVEQEG